MSTNEELLALVRSLTERVVGLETRITSLTVNAEQEVPEETMVAIAAAVAAYLGHRAKRHQPHFTTAPGWQASTRRSQLSHHPLYTR